MSPDRRPAPEEIEVKLPSGDLEEVRERLAGQGGVLCTPLDLERDDLYDDPEKSLSLSGKALRLRRRGHRAVLTLKGPAHFERGAKVREEREITVSDGEEADRILAGLGFVKAFRYEKRREEWVLDGCTIALDETPIGRFVEVEGDPAAIRRVLARLGLDSTEAIPYTYAELYARRRREDPSLPADMVFHDT